MDEDVARFGESFTRFMEAMTRIAGEPMPAVVRRLSNPDQVVSRTAGVTASFMKEVVRKASLLASLRGSDDSLAVTDEDVGSALDELLDEGNALTRSLLGGGPREGTEWLRSWAEPDS